MTDTETSPLTHAICESCWVKKKPGLWPVRAVGQDPNIAYVCCYCGNPTWASIWIRDPAEFPGHCAHQITISPQVVEPINGHEHEVESP